MTKIYKISRSVKNNDAETLWTFQDEHQTEKYSIKFENIPGVMRGIFDDCEGLKVYARARVHKFRGKIVFSQFQLVDPCGW